MNYKQLEEGKKLKEQIDSIENFLNETDPQNHKFYRLILYWGSGNLELSHLSFYPKIRKIFQDELIELKQQFDEL